MSIEELMKKMKVKYIADLALKIEELRALVLKKDFLEIESILHKLKGSGASYGLPEVSEFGAKYEQKAKNNSLSDDELNNLVPELEELYKAHAA
ncbi:MAG: Hpt domain-containing protein [Bdellovibrionales bacterium]